MNNILSFSIQQVGIDNINLTSIAETIIENKFEKFSVMDLDAGRFDEQALTSEELFSQFVPFEKGQFLSKLKETVLYCRIQKIRNLNGNDEYPISAIKLNKKADFLEVSFSFDPESYILKHSELKCLEDFKAMFMQILTYFPTLKSADAGLANAMKQLDQETGVRRQRALHLTFGPGLQWISIVSPKMYHPFYKKEDLLKTPAYHIEEWENDVIFIQLCENPFELFSQENKKIYKEANEWLFQCIDRVELNKPRKAT